MHKFRPVLLLFVLAAFGSFALARGEDSDVEWGPWSVLLPFDHPSGGKGVDQDHPPERELKSMRLDGEGPDFTRKWRGKDGRDIQWRLARSGEVTAPDMDKVDFLTLVPDVYPDKSNTLTAFSTAYAHRSFRSPRNQKVDVSFGSDDGARVWLNGKLINDKAVLRGLNPKSDPLTLDLKAGLNHLFVKVCNEGGGWSCQLTGPIGAEPEAPETPHDAINAAIDRGVVYLLQTQNLDGSWSYEAKGYRNGQTALSLYALLKSGLTEDHQAVRRGLEYLRTHPATKTYSASCQILALISTKSDRHTDWIYKTARDLVDWQEGGFGYPSGNNDPGDLSNTQYGALGLWASTTVGYDVPSRVWLLLLRNAMSHQNEDGGFGYRMGAASTGSMTVAGLTIMATCREGFGEAGFPSQLRKKAEQSMELGLQWLAVNFSSEKNPGADGGADERWKHYYLYGMERLAALLKIDRIGDYDWYRQGSHFYVKTQGDKGQWGTAYGEGEPNTAFGLIFLSRGTASLTGAKASTRTGRLYVTDGADAEVILRASGDTPLNLWLSEFPEATIKKYAREGENGFGLYIDKVEYFANGASVAVVEADARKPWNKQTHATRHSFANRGHHKVKMSVHLAAGPNANGAEPLRIDSPELEVRVDELLEDWMLDYPDDELGNIGLGQRKEVTASSEFDGGHAAGLAFDGLMGTAWVSKKDDKSPTLTVEFKRALRADRLLISHAESQELSHGHYDRATKIEIQLGAKRDPLTFDLDPNEEHKTVLMLPRKSSINELIIRVVERETGSKHPGQVGFAEVELRLGD